MAWQCTMVGQPPPPTVFKVPSHCCTGRIWAYGGVGQFQGRMMSSVEWLDANNGIEWQTHSAKLYHDEYEFSSVPLPCCNDEPVEMVAIPKCGNRTMGGILINGEK